MATLRRASANLVVPLTAHLRVLSLETCKSPHAGRAYQVGLLVLHLGGLLVVARLAHWPAWSAPALLLAFSVPQLAGRRWFAESLASLVVVYAVAAVRLVWVYTVRQPMPPALEYEWALALGAAWAALIALNCVGRAWMAWVAAGVGVAALFAWKVWVLAPPGVSGSDPFAYVQMALDLAAHGSPLHHFPLAPLAAGLGLPTLPVTHVGYVLPDAAGWAPTVWPPGFSALLAAAYRLSGERLLLGFNAWVGLASLALTGVLAVRLASPPTKRSAALAVGAAAVILLATSPEQFLRLAVPLADGAAQLLTTASVVLALSVVSSVRASRAKLGPSQTASSGGKGRRLLSACPLRTRGGVRCLSAGHAIWSLAPVLLGLCLGLAFSVRYTQALLAPGLVVAALWALPTNRQRWVFALALIAAGVLAAAPDLLYRTRLYGAPWRFGTGELALFELGAVPGAARQLGVELLHPAEFGWLWALALVGAVWLWHHQRLALMVLAAAYLPPVVFHLFYPFVRARDILFVLPPLAALSALGGAALAAWLWGRGTAARLAVVAGLLVVGAVRVAPLLARAPGFYTFGGLLPEQRLALASLADLTEPNAVIAGSLNSGAVELYSGRLTVRPGRLLQPEAAWTNAQWLIFVEALRAEERPLYVLADSPELEPPLAALRARYALEHVADLYVPVYVLTGGSENDTVPLWRVVW